MSGEANVYGKLRHCYECVRKKTDFVPRIAIVLGSGLGDYAEAIRVEAELPYSEIEGFPVSTVPGHAGKFIFGYVDKVPAGGVNTSFHAGDLMMIKDHISVFAPNPLIGPNLEELGTRFPDMSHVYDPGLQEAILRAAKENNIFLQEGVYAQLTGPSFESPAEIRMLRTLGCDAVGMSTVVEAIAANHMGMKICGISCICNLAAGMTARPLTHAEVQEAADRAAPNFKRLVTESVKKMLA